MNSIQGLLTWRVVVAYEIQTPKPTLKISDLRPHESRTRLNSNSQVAGSAQVCNDPLETCTGHTIGEINHEYDDGKRYQEVDGQAQGGFGDGDYSRKDFDLGGFTRL